jgi:hypothetical protein
MNPLSRYGVICQIISSGDHILGSHHRAICQITSSGEHILGSHHRAICQITRARSNVCFSLIECSLQVQVYKKTAKQPLPSLKLYNPPSAAGGSGEQAAACGQILLLL